MVALCGIALILTSCATSETKLKEKQSDIYASAGVEALQKGEYTEALGALKEAVKLTPKSATVWNNLGLAYLGKGESARAETAWKKAIDLDEQFTSARMNLGALYLQQKKYPSAEKYLKEAAKDLTFDQAEQVKYNLGLLYLGQGKRVLAQQQFKLALSENENYCPAWFSLGQIQKENGQIGQAAESLKKSVAGPCFHNPRAHFELGNLYLKAKEPALAKSKLIEVIQFFPQSDWAKKAELTLNQIR